MVEGLTTSGGRGGCPEGAGCTATGGDKKPGAAAKGLGAALLGGGGG